MKKQHPLQKLYDALEKAKVEQVKLINNGELLTIEEREAVVVAWNALDDASLAIHKAIQLIHVS